ncbi:hypothetical protein FRC16_000353 [Serendipita sp. 398]|nr:hypothetical protein FRC16_000353 [Serendipita sp. 398]
MPEPTIYKIFCVFVGENVSFRVKVDKDETVAELKDEIKKNESLNIGTRDLTLFHIELTDEGNLAGDSRESLLDVPVPVPMNPLRKLTDYFPNSPPDGKVHIVIKLPPNALFPILSTSRSALDDLPTSISTREETVKVLYERLNFHRFIQVRGTPASGKTTLAALLVNYIKKKEGIESLYISCWPKYDTNWLHQLSAQGWRKRGDILVIDEAHTTYWDKLLWNDLFKRIQIGHHHRIILFSSYGSAIGESKQNSPCIDVTPSAEMVIAPAQLVNLRPIDHNDGYGAVGLLLTEAECKEMIEKYFPPIYIGEDLAKHIYSLTSGHPGGILELLRIITTHKSYHRFESTRAGHNYSLDDFHQFINLDELWKGLILGTAFRRGLPTIDNLRNPAYAAIFRAVLNNHYVEEADLNEKEKVALGECIKKGWLFADVIHPDDPLGPIIVAHFFTTQLHRWTIDFYLGRCVETLFIKEDNLLQFVIAVLSCFSPSQLAIPRKAGPSFIPRPPEAQFQDEFYRCSHLYSGGLVTFPEYGTAKGRADFYIPTKKWGVELLRDGDRLEKHAGRFSDQGAYAKTMDFDDYIILDFRTSMPRDKHPGIQGLYHVKFTQDYGRLDIYTNTHDLVEPLVLLKNVAVHVPL